MGRARLQQGMRREYEELRRTIESHALSNEETFGGTVAAVACVAYHLGVVRQKVAGLPTS